MRWPMWSGSSWKRKPGSGKIGLRSPHGFPVRVRPQKCRGVAQPGRALGSGPRGRRFKSSRPDQFSRFSSENPQNLAWRVTRFLLRLSVLGTEWPVRQIQPAVGIIRDFSPPSVAIMPFQALVEAKRYPSRYRDATNRLVATMNHRGGPRELVHQSPRGGLSGLGLGPKARVQLCP